ncbi:MAG TPA: 1-acyl-sn-glycerol-3-phosphate acyltransferase [Bacteriovoracaceae bacterium]|nr:1-acyl-sn-glycerol-3-phosphate acyltransferase [Bacteriovoracaceae bacterium]
MIHFLFAVSFKLTGWKFKSEIPDDLRSFIFLGAPHTSNYDFIPSMAIVHLGQRNAKFVIKNDWMKFPLNLFMKPAGAIGIDREKLKSGGKGSTTDTMAQLFRQYPELVLMIAPEGTRKPNPNWKTGFYYIAQKANIPIVLGYADYRRKEAGFGPAIYPTDFDKDMRTIMEFYQTITAKVPENFKLDPKFL